MLRAENPRIESASYAIVCFAIAWVLAGLRFRKRHSRSMKEKPALERRADSAEQIEKLVNGLIESLDKIPSYRGKARFMDKVFKVQTHAHNLAWNLRYDVNEVKNAPLPPKGAKR